MGSKKTITIFGILLIIILVEDFFGINMPKTKHKMKLKNILLNKKLQMNNLGKLL